MARRHRTHPVTVRWVDPATGQETKAPRPFVAPTARPPRRRRSSKLASSKQRSYARYLLATRDHGLGYVEVRWLDRDEMADLIARLTTGDALDGAYRERLEREP